MGRCGLTSPGLFMNGQVKPYYVGSFRHNLDAKNRLTIPSKWRFAGDDGDVYLALPDQGDISRCYRRSKWTNSMSASPRSY